MEFGIGMEVEDEASKSCSDVQVFADCLSEYIRYSRHDVA